MFNYIKTWADEKLVYLRVKEVVRSSESAKQHLSLLEVFGSSFAAMTSTNVPALQRQGADILRAKYETTYSRWVYEHPEEIKVRMHMLHLIFFLSLFLPPPQSYFPFFVM
jgi:hypothetical protein